MWAFLFLWMILIIVTSLLVLWRCTFLIYVLFCVPIIVTILFFVFKNDTSQSNQNREVYFQNFHFGGHRGSPERAPENTIPSFEKARADGCDVVEFDIHMSSDGVPLLMHDETTGRTGKTDLTVSLATWNQLSNVSLRPVNEVNASIPTLTETIDWCVRSGTKMLFDMKNDNVELVKAVAKEIKRRNLYQKVMVSSFNPIIPWRLKKIDPKIVTGITLDRSYYSYADDFRQAPFTTNMFLHWAYEFLDEINMIVSPLHVLPRFLGVDVVMLSYRLISEDTIREARERGLSTIVWTVNDPDYMSILAKLNVPFLTDHSDRVDRKLFSAKKSSE